MLTRKCLETNVIILFIVNLYKKLHMIVDNNLCYDEIIDFL